MKNTLSLLLLGITLGTASLDASADASRGLWACQSVKNSNVFVSWRMRNTDAPKSTTYKLYADGNLVETTTDKTNVSLDLKYANATFSLEVLNKEGEVIDSQEGVKCDHDFFHHIKLNRPQNYWMNNTSITYSPNDCSAYDMDGDGEQEIIVKWEPSNAGATAEPTAPQILDCYKLNGTQLWRIDFGTNVLAGCRFTFLCYDFDGDGYGEVIAKTAQGSKDATGNFLSKGVAQGANHYASSINSSGVIAGDGKEWLTCFDGRSGKELATIDYWPYYNIRNDWGDPREKKLKVSEAAHRANWFKACVAFLDVNGKPQPCAVTNRGIYAYSYAAAYSWNGQELKQLWRHTSDQMDQGIYGEGAHSITCGDVDDDGFDEIIVGAAAIDHNGQLLWRTGLGHGDATHLGDFDPNNPGLEYFMVTEGSDRYNGALIDARTGRIIQGKRISNVDTGRGLILDCDSQYDGAEAMIGCHDKLYAVNGTDIADWHTGTTKNSSINFAIYWDGDLLREYHDRSHIDKWNTKTKTWDRVIDVWQYGYGANNNNSTKYNPCLQADLYGDWREEAVYWAENNGDCYLTIFTTTTPSDYKLPWLRDDHTYDMAVAWQNCGYNQPPHIGYDPFTYFKNLANQKESASLTKHGEGSSSQEIAQGDSIVEFFYTISDAYTVEVTGLPNGITYTTENNDIRFSGIADDEPGEYNYTITAKGEGGDATKNATFTITPRDETGLAEIKAQNGKIQIYPNPMDETAEVTFRTQAQGSISWSITDMVGVIQQKGSVEAVNSTARFTINRETLKDGIYLVTLRAKNENYYKILIVNK